MTAPVRAPSPNRAPSTHRGPRFTPAAAPATQQRPGAAATADPAAATDRSRPAAATAAPGAGTGAAPGAHRSPASPPPPPARPRLRLVDDRRLQLVARRHRTRLLFVATGVLLVASLFGVVICHAMLVTGQGRLDQLEREVVAEQTRYQALRLRVAELEAPGRIVAEAQGRLGMVDPPEITYLTPVATDVTVPAPGPRDEADAASWRAVKPLLSGHG